MIQADAMDGDDGAREEKNNWNPFLGEGPILDVFFKLLSLEELAKCRLVSSLWYEESLSTWRSKATIKFEEEAIVSTTDDGTGRTTSIVEFLDHWEAREWRSCPFNMFSLHRWTFEAGNVEQERFLQLVGRHITSLTLEECSFVGREHFRWIIYAAFPKLKFLTMDSCHVDNVYCVPTNGNIFAYKEPAFGVHNELKSLVLSACVPDSMMDLLGHFHKLENLHMRDTSMSYRNFNLLETIRLIRAQSQSKLPLKIFDAEFFLEFAERDNTASSIELLKLQEQLNFPLQRLTIFFYPFVEDSNFNDVIRDILQHHSSTLKSLEFIGDEEESYEDLYEICNSFPAGLHLENLEKLVIRSPCFTGNFKYLRVTPNLRVLKIEDYDISMSESDNLFSNSAQLEIEDWTLPTLTDLTFDLPLSVCNMRKLMKWMPNVERLEGFELNDVKFSMVCNSWKHLKVLVDAGEELTDESIIGPQNANEAGDDEETQNVPNITKLKNLTYFATVSSKLTSASVHEGFLKLANLEMIVLGENTELEDEAKAALGRRTIRLCIRSDSDSDSNADSD